MTHVSTLICPVFTTSKEAALGRLHKGGRPSAGPSVVSFVLALNKAHVLALNTAHVSRLNKADVLALNTAHVLRLKTFTEKILPGTGAFWKFSVYFVICWGLSGILFF